DQERGEFLEVLRARRRDGEPGGRQCGQGIADCGTAIDHVGAPGEAISLPMRQAPASGQQWINRAVRAMIRAGSKPRREDPRMPMPRLRAALVALCAVAGLAATPSALADGGTISFRIVKAGLVIGGSAGSGTLNFHGRPYHLVIGGI